MILNIRTVDYLAKAPNSSFITTLLHYYDLKQGFSLQFIAQGSAEFSSLSGH